MRLLENRPDDEYYEDPDSPAALVRQGHKLSLRDLLLTSEQVRSMPPLDYLVDELIPTDSLTLLYGSSTAGKSFLAMDLALHIATGSWWHGRATKKGPVVYVVGEGVAGVGRRLDAWSRHARIPDLDTFEVVHWLPRAVNLLDMSEVGELCGLVEELRPVLVVLDTYSRCLGGGDENGPKDSSTAVVALDRIRNVAGSCVLTIHHSGKDATAGARGHSSLKAAQDVELELTASDHLRTLKNTKSKNDKQAEPLHLALLPVDDTKSCVLVASDRVADDGSMSKSVADTLDVLREIATPDGISTATWRDVALEYGVGRSSFYTAVKELLSAGSVQNVGSEKQPRYVPSEQVQPDAA